MAGKQKLAKFKGQPEKPAKKSSFPQKVVIHHPVKTPSKASPAPPALSPYGKKTAQRADVRKPQNSLPIEGTGLSSGGGETTLEVQKKELQQTQADRDLTRDQFATLFDSAPVGYVTLDGSGNILEANLIFCSMLGLTRRKIIHKKFKKYVSPDDQGMFSLYLDSLKKKTGSHPSEVLTLQHAATFHRVRLEGWLETLESSAKVSLFRIAVKDAAVQERIEIAQEAQQALMAVVVDGVSDAIVTIDEEQQIVLFNQAAANMFRCPASSALGQSINRFIPERFWIAHQRHIQQFGQNPSASRPMGGPREIFGLRSDGEEFPAEGTISQVERKGKGEKLFTVVLRDITERRRVQEALKKEEQFIEAILDTAAALMMVTDSQGRIVRFNRACEVLTGYSCEEVQGKLFWEQFSPSTDREEVKGYFRAFFHGRLPSFYETSWIAKDKQLRWIAWSNAVIRNERGQPEFLIAIGIDLTEQRKIQETLEEERRFASQVLDTTGSLVVILDPRLRILRINRACEQTVRYSFQDLKGQPFVNLCVLSGEDDQGTRKIVESCQGGRLPPLFEAALVNQSRQLTWIHWETTAITDEKGHVKFFIATGTDITARKKAEQLLQQNQEQLQAILDHSPVSIWLKDLEGRYLKVNRQFEKNAGLTEKEILGKTDSQLFQSERVRQFYEIDNTILQTGQAYESDEVSYRSDDILIEHVFKFPIMTHKGKPYALCGIATDITRRKQTETRLQETSQRLEMQQLELRSLASQLLIAQEEERRRISRDLHDDVNQRLALLSLKLQAARDGLSEHHLVTPMIEELFENVANLSDDIRRLAYQYHPSILDDLGLGSALRSLCEDFEKWEGISVTCELPDGGRKVSQVVGTCLYRVVQESLRNISRHAQASAVHLVLREEGQGITLSIRDNGKGFEGDGLLSRGLGFVSMRERVRLVGGTLLVESQPGHGTTVKVSIPKNSQT